MRYISLFFTFFSITSMAQTPSGWELFKDSKDIYEKAFDETKRGSEINANYLRDETLRVENYNVKISILKNMIKERELLKRSLYPEIKTAMDRIGFLDQMFSRKAKFYRCVDDTLRKQGHINIKECRRITAAQLDAKEEAEIKDWDRTLGYTDSEAKVKIKQLEEDIKFSEKGLKKVRENLKIFEGSLKTQVSRVQRMKELEGEYRDLEGQKKFLNCDASTPTINLELEKPYPGATITGPFHGIPRDNQDGLGTCYANAARNLLVGMSGGNVDPSFLDIALTYKKSANQLSQDGLNAGSSCHAIESLKKIGYCPQRFAPLETGEKNHAFDSLLGSKNDKSFWLQAQTIELLKDYFQGTDGLSKNPEMKKVILQSSYWMIEQLKSNPRIKMPLPIVRVNLPPVWKLRSTYQEKKANLSSNENEFITDFNENYKKFYPLYLKAVVDLKSADQIFEVFKTLMAPFITKYGITSNDLQEWLRSYKFEIKSDIEDPNYKQSIKDSLVFLKAMTGKEGQKDEEFLDFCLNSFGTGLDFLGKIQPLLKKLKELNVDSDKLIKKSGDLASNEDLMQLAVAPSCLHSENRRPIPFESYCDTEDTIKKIKSSGRPIEDQIVNLRERVVMSLLKGMPLGNTFSSSEGSHINTIVGMRFNPNSSKCEYLIRESQTGESIWQTEKNIFISIDTLTEVRKR